MTAAAIKTQNGRAPRVPAKSERAGGLEAAVLAVQAAAPALIRNATGQIQSRTYMYVTNDQVVDVVLPLLVQQQLLWRTWPTRYEDGQPGLRYRMTHVPSGEYDEDVMPLMLEAPTSQALGSAITYDRRYALVAYLNLTVDPDDDGAAASTAVRDRYAEAEAAHADLDKKSQSPQPEAKPPEPTERRITANQRTKLLIPRAKKAKLTDGEFANVILAAGGAPTREWRSPEHATQTLNRLLDQLPARLKDAVLDGIAQAKP